MTMHYELTGRHEVCFMAKIGLTVQVNMHSNYRIWCFWNGKKPHRLPLKIGIWTAYRRTPRKDDIDRNNKLNNKITIISIEQTAVHHSNRHVALERPWIWVCSKRDFLWNIFIPMKHSFTAHNKIDLFKNPNPKPSPILTWPAVPNRKWYTLTPLFS